MLNSFCVLMAACAAGGPGDWAGAPINAAPAANCGCNQGAGRPGVAPPVGYFGPRLRTGVLGRLRNRRSQSDGYGEVQYGVSGPVIWNQPAMSQMPAAVSPASPYVSHLDQEPPLATALAAVHAPASEAADGPQAQVTTVTVQRPDLRPAGTPNLQVDPKYADKVGHEEDYSWVTGHLFYVHADGGRWVVRYGLPEVVDKFGGSVVLAPGVDMRNYREGDLVCVYGRILDEGRGSPALGGALYTVNSINLVNRADP